MIGDIRKFRFWCQKVLPLVYDDSLSYYEVLCKVVQYLNKVIEDVNSIPDYIDAVITERLSDEHLQELIEQFILDIESAISSNNEGDNTNSSDDYNVGQMLWWNGKLYRVIRQIDAGDTFIVDTNIALVNFEDLFNEFVDEVKHDISANDDGTSATATQNWTAGTWLWLNDVLYKVKNDITQGNAYVFSGGSANVEQITVEDEFHDEALARTNADSGLQTAIDDEALARANADSGLQTAIDDEALARANADTAINVKIGNLENLDTTDKTSIVNAINNIFTMFDYTTPERHGAVGDGVTDDTQAIASALQDGKPVYFAGTYLVTDTIALSSDTMLFGKGTIKRNNVGYTLFSGDNVHDVVIIGLNFEGINDFTAGLSDTGDIYITRGNNITIDSCSFMYVNDYGAIVFHKVINSNVTNNKLTHIGYMGVWLLGECENIVINNNIFDGVEDFSHENSYCVACSSYEYGAVNVKDNAYRNKNITISNNTCKTDTAFWEALDCHGGENIVFSDNTIMGFLVGIAVVSNASENWSCEGISITGNSIAMGENPYTGITSGSAISLNAGTDIDASVVVSGNILTNNGSSLTTHGIAVQTDNGSILNNIIKGFTYDIYIVFGQHNVVSNNHIEDALTAGVGFYDTYNASSCDFISNVFENIALAYKAPPHMNPIASMFYFENNVYNNITGITDSVVNILPDVYTSLPSANKYARGGCKVRNLNYSTVGDVLYWVGSGTDRHNEGFGYWSAIKTVAI